MKLIEKLSDMIEDEIDGAECYAKMAVKYKEERPELANLMYALSGEELGHMQKLHNMVVRIIEEYRKDKGEPPASMMAIYEYLHNKQIDEAREVKDLQALYRGE